MRSVVIAGVAMSNFGNHISTGIELFTNVGLKAISKSNIEPNNIEALFFGNCLGEISEKQGHMNSLVHSALGLNKSSPALRFESACATATVAIINAALLVRSGVYDIVLAGGTEKVSNMSTSLSTSYFATALHHQYETKTGITFPAVFAMATNLYSIKYKIPIKQLKKHMANIAIKNHYHGNKNPNAHIQKIININNILNSNIISEPLQLLDCCPFSDGASAVVLMSENKAKNLIKKPIYIIGVGQASSGPLFNKKDLTRVVSREISSKKAYSEAKITPFDIDVCELHDCFTIAEIIALEGLGFYKFGKGYKSSTNRETYLNSNGVVINPSGGLKSRGHAIGATGAAQITEIVEQLRGESKDRQVKRAITGLVDTMGGSLGTVCNIILRTKS